MKLNLSQTKLVGLTMKLDLKAKEYKMLCKKLEKYKAENIDENDGKLYGLLEEFKKNHDEIKEIKEQLKEIENIKDVNIYEKTDYSDIFKSRKNINTNIENPRKEEMMIEYKETLWQKIKRKLRAVFKL